VAGKRPINAELPLGQPASEVDRVGAESKVEARRRPRRRRSIPGALKGIAVLVAFAIVFLLAAVLGGGGAAEDSGETAPAPTSAAPSGEAEAAKTPTAEAAAELGYPSFATNNTTRVGGSDPAEIAAAVALAVFPSSTPVQRPAAVTIVDEGDWQAAVAASVLMAEPVRAPLLVSSGGELPDASSQALAALDPQGSKATQGTQAFAVGGGAGPDGLKTTELEGRDAAALAASIAKLREQLGGEPPKHLLLAPESAPELAAPAAAWAARSGDSVLFTATDKLPAATRKALRSHPKVPVYVLGPSSAISSNVFREVDEIVGRVRRVAGETPVENAIALARYANGGFGWNVNDPGHGFVVARAEDPLAAAVASPLSASGTWGPLLLTDAAATLPVPLREYLLDVKPGYATDPTRAFYNHIWVIGDQDAIDVNQQAEIDELAELAKIKRSE
jgi:hypothetical protein